MILGASERPSREAAGAAGPPAGTRTVVKICGLTNLEDARAALEAGADWLGFVVYEPSPRHVEPGRAAEIIAALPGITAVAVMVETPPDRALEIARRMGATRVQMHRPIADWPVDFPIPTTLVVPVADDGTLTTPLPDPRHLVMLDTAHPELAGGTGASFHWESARLVARERPVLLAGGLGPVSVRVAIAQVRPFGVDASTRLERGPGLKDHERVRHFVGAVRVSDRTRQGT